MTHPVHHRKTYQCDACGWRQDRWAQTCPACQSWGGLTTVPVTPPNSRGGVSVGWTITIAVLVGAATYALLTILQAVAR